MTDLATDDRPLTTGVRWRVATIGHAPDARWVVHGAEFAEKALAEEWAHYMLWFGTGTRPRHADLVRVVDGQAQIPRLMQGKMREEKEELAHPEVAGG